MKSADTKCNNCHGVLSSHFLMFACLSISWNRKNSGIVCTIHLQLHRWRPQESSPMTPILSETVAVSQCRNSPSQWKFCFFMVFTAQSEMQGWQKLCRSFKTGIYLQVFLQRGKNFPDNSLHICASFFKGKYLGFGQHNTLSCSKGLLCSRRVPVPACVSYNLCAGNLQA